MKQRLMPMTMLLLTGVLALASLFSVSASDRQLPIYCVDTPQKMCSISFDAAWGDVRVR